MFICEYLSQVSLLNSVFYSVPVLSPFVNSIGHA